MTLETFSLQFDDVYIILNQHQYLKVEDKLTLCMIRYWLSIIINPRRGCAARVTVLGLSVCLSVRLSVCLFVRVSSRTTGYEEANE